MTHVADWQRTFRPGIPSAARVCAHLPDGKDHYPANRAVAEPLIA